MKYDNIITGEFISRPNRFIAEARIDGRIHRCHVKNTGRCRELLIPGACLYLQKAVGPNRKTHFDLIAVHKGNTVVNIDSQAPNKVVKEWIEEGGLFEKIRLLKTEFKYGNSRFDLYAEADGGKNLIEVKGVTLERDGAALFPDAPTERGVKHINELCRCAHEGYGAYIFFVVQMKGVKYFAPNYETHAAFGEALTRAEKCGVNILCADCFVSPDEIRIDAAVPVRLNG